MPETVAVADHFRLGSACRESVGFCPFPFSGNGAQQIIELGGRHDGRRREHGKGLDGLQILLSELPNGQGVQGQNPQVLSLIRNEQPMQSCTGKALEPISPS